MLRSLLRPFAIHTKYTGHLNDAVKLNNNLKNVIGIYSRNPISATADSVDDGHLNRTNNAHTSEVIAKLKNTQTLLDHQLKAKSLDVDTDMITSLIVFNHTNFTDKLEQAEQKTERIILTHKLNDIQSSNNLSKIINLSEKIATYSLTGSVASVVLPLIATFLVHQMNRNLYWDSVLLW